MFLRSEPPSITTSKTRTTGPFFEKIQLARDWMSEAKPDVCIVVYNDHASAFSLELIPTFALGVAPMFQPADEGYGPRQVPAAQGHRHRWHVTSAPGRTSRLDQPCLRPSVHEPPRRRPDHAGRGPRTELLREAGSEGIELVMWLIMRGALDAEVREVYGMNHVPTSNTSNGLIVVEDSG